MLSNRPSLLIKTILSAHSDRNYSDSLPETFPKGDETKHRLSQSVISETWSTALSTDSSIHRKKARNIGTSRDTHRTHPSMPLQEMGSFLRGLDWWGMFEKSCVCSCSGQQVWKLPTRAPTLFCYYIFLGPWKREQMSQREWEAGWECGIVFLLIDSSAVTNA